MGCDRLLEEKPKAPKQFELGLEGEKCLAEIPGLLNLYFQQNLEEGKLQTSFHCLDKTLVQFLDFTKGADASSYQFIELHNFVSKFVFKREISLDLSRQIMKLKMALLGGSAEAVTRKEFSQLRQLLTTLETELRRLYPHLRIYLLKEKLNVTKSEHKARVTLALKDLKLTLINLFTPTHFREVGYALPELDLLLTELTRFDNSEGSEPLFDQWRQALPLIEKFQILLVGESESRADQPLSDAEITELVDILIEMFRLKIEYHGTGPMLNWDAIGDQMQIAEWAEAGFALLKRTFALRKFKPIMRLRVDQIVDDLARSPQWPERVKAMTVKKAIRQFLVRFMGASAEETGPAIEYRFVEQIYRDYQAYQVIQRALMKVFAQNGARPITEILTILESYPLTAELKKTVTLNVREQSYFVNAWNEFLLILKSPVGRHWTESGNYFASTQKGELWKYPELTRINGLRAITSWYFRSYGTNSVLPKDDSLGVDKIRLVFEEFKEFGGETGLFDLRNSDTASRSLREADMFTPEGNGDGRVQFVELMDLLATLWSGGVNGVASFKSSAEYENCLLTEKDYFHEFYFHFECSSGALRTHFLKIFPSLPKFHKFVSGFSVSQWALFYADLLEISRVCPSDMVGLETGDQRTMTMVLHYIENLFAVYDRNRNELFNEQEIENAFPRFNQFITEMTKNRVKVSNPKTYWALDAVGYNWSKMGLEVFKFLVFKGRSPTSGELVNFMTEGFWGDREPLGEANRQAIVKVFAALKSEVSNSTVQCNVKR
jgi:hypothetical protein